MSLACCQQTSSPPQAELWKLRYSNQAKQHLINPDNSPWGRLICTWHEKKENNTVLIHHYAACIDTRSWGVYLDCRPRKIFAKIFAQIFARPIHALFKTAYHVTMIPIILEIKNTYQGFQTTTICLKNSIKSIADIIRTPIYGLAMIVASFAVLIFGIADPENLYSGRAFLGEIECSANWGESHTAWTLAHCFQPYSITILEEYNHQKCVDDTIYDSQDPLEIQLSDYARRCIMYKRKKFDIFDCHSLNPHKTYISPILKPII